MKKNFKRFVSVAMVGVMAAAMLSGCGKKTDSDEGTKSPETTTEAVTETQAETVPETTVPETEPVLENPLVLSEKLEDGSTRYLIDVVRYRTDDNGLMGRIVSDDFTGLLAFEIPYESFDTMKADLGINDEYGLFYVTVAEDLDYSYVLGGSAFGTIEETPVMEVAKMEVVENRDEVRAALNEYKAAHSTYEEDLATVMASNAESWIDRLNEISDHTATWTYEQEQEFLDKCENEICDPDLIMEGSAIELAFVTGYYGLDFGGTRAESNR